MYTEWWSFSLFPWQNEWALQGLDAKEMEMYKRKLELVELALQNNPNTPQNQEKFKDGMAVWLPLEYGHISAILSGDVNFH